MGIMLVLLLQPRHAFIALPLSLFVAHFFALWLSKLKGMVWRSEGGSNGHYAMDIGEGFFLIIIFIIIILFYFSCCCFSFSNNFFFLLFFNKKIFLHFSTK
jgi:hypothetical protein